MKVAISYLTKDRVELSEQTIKSFAGLVTKHNCDVISVDGSSTEEGKNFWKKYGATFSEHNGDIHGGADAAIVYALTEMLKGDYTHVGLCENDVLLAPDWFERTMRLFDEGRAAGLEVGAASARAYDDRILVQRDGWALMHNLGAGHVIFTRQAAELVLANYRSAWWPDNRAIFAQLCGRDIGRYAAFRGSARWLTADWGFDAILAQHGLASVALVPTATLDMLGDDLTEQGLRLATEPVEERRDEEAFEQFVKSTAAIRESVWRPQTITSVHRSSMNGGASLVFPHQMTEFDREGDWRLKWSQGFGPFSWRANEDGCRLQVKVFGSCTFLVSGGERAAKINITDTGSGYEIDPEVPPVEHGITQLAVPGGCVYRDIVMTCAAGAIFYGIQCQEPQPLPSIKFDHSDLPPV